MSAFDTIECVSAAQLLDKLSPHGETFATAHGSDWIFRGHSNAAWPLVPSAFRQGAKLVDLHRGEWSTWSNRDQIHAEARTLLYFIEEADTAGLSLPGNLADLRDIFNNPFEESWYRVALEEGREVWPPPATWPVVALAQHYGLATRFLDWTRSALIAVYFAAAETVTNGASQGTLAVWAFSTASEKTHRGFMDPYGVQRGAWPNVVTAPYATSPNLHSQRGVHIARTLTKIGWSDAAARDDLAEYLDTVQEFSRQLDQPALLKFVIASSEAPVLLWHLHKAGVTAATLFPGYYGAARSALEQQHRRRP